MKDLVIAKGCGSCSWAPGLPVVTLGDDVIPVQVLTVRCNVRDTPISVSYEIVVLVHEDMDDETANQLDELVHDHGVDVTVRVRVKGFCGYETFPWKGLHAMREIVKGCREELRLSR